MEQNQGQLARKVALGGVLGSFLTTSLISLGIYLFQTQLIGQFSQDPEVASEAGVIWPLVCVFVLGDTLIGTQSGVLKGLGFQLGLSVVTIVSLYVVGLPLMFVWADSDGLLGLWQAMLVSYLVLNVLLCGIYIRPSVWGQVRKGMGAMELSEGV